MTIRDRNPPGNANEISWPILVPETLPVLNVSLSNEIRATCTPSTWFWRSTELRGRYAELRHQVITQRIPFQCSCYSGGISARGLTSTRGCLRGWNINYCPMTRCRQYRLSQSMVRTSHYHPFESAISVCYPSSGRRCCYHQSPHR